MKQLAYRGMVSGTVLMAAAVILLGGCSDSGGGDKGSGKKGGASTADTVKLVKAVPADYPLKTCLVSKKAYGGEMGDPVELTREGRKIYFCCKGCVKKFNKEPAKFLVELDKAAAMAKKPGAK